ncbi:MAG: polysaccharide deacetylase family protein [Magnetococcales bacterium]|nr:polysaccharide deacetylase family protein [Magnetococcales bacterium]
MAFGGNPILQTLRVVRPRVFLRNAFNRLRRESDATALARLLPHLYQERIPFTFFVTAFLIERETEWIRRLADQGHEIAVHGYHHCAYAFFTPQAIRDDLTRARDALARIGLSARGLRPPFLSHHPQTASLAAELGFTYISGAVGFDYPLYANRTAALAPFREPDSGLMQVPITSRSDYDLLAYEQRDITQAITCWRQEIGADATLLFHPLHAGHRDRVEPLLVLWREWRDRFHLVTVSDKLARGEGVALTMDVGALTKWDLIRALTHCR